MYRFLFLGVLLLGGFSSYTFADARDDAREDIRREERQRDYRREDWRRQERQEDFRKEDIERKRIQDEGKRQDLDRYQRREPLEETVPEGDEGHQAKVK